MLRPATGHIQGGWPELLPTDEVEEELYGIVEEVDHPDDCVEENIVGRLVRRPYREQTVSVSEEIQVLWNMKDQEHNTDQDQGGSGWRRLVCLFSRGVDGSRASSLGLDYLDDGYRVADDENENRDEISQAEIDPVPRSDEEILPGIVDETFVNIGLRTELQVEADQKLEVDGYQSEHHDAPGYDDVPQTANLFALERNQDGYCPFNSQ